jgi:hypothetical protein
MTRRDASLVLSGVLLGIPLGLIISSYAAQILQLAAGGAGYVIFIVVALLAASAVVVGQDALEGVFRFAERLVGRSSSSERERPEEEDRLPVNPWGTPNPYRMTKDRDDS